ncbi:MAG: hypothetical protein ACI4SG_02380 [Oligosphaeraceae bacterium]
MMERNRLLGGLLVFTILLACGSLIFGFFSYRSYQDVLAELEEAKTNQPSPAFASSPVVEAPLERPAQSLDAEEEIQGLTAYVEKLEKENRSLREQLSQASSFQGQREDNRGGDGRRRGTRGGPPDMEALKEQDPEAYERFQQMRQEREQRRQEQRQRREDVLAAVNTRRLSAEQQETLQNFQDLMAEIEENDGPGGPGRGEQFRSLMEMRGAVQEILLEDLGNRLGTDSVSLTEGVQDILSVVGQDGAGLGGPGGGPRGGGMMPPPPPGQR